MKKIVFTNQKGGVGKSTLALNFGYYLNLKGYKVCFVDMDNNQLVLHRTVQSINTFRNINDVGKGYDYCIIDTAPYITNEYETVLKKSDLIVIPIQITLPDYIGLEKVISSVKKYKKKTLILPNKIKGNRLSKVKMEILHEIEKFNVPISEPYIRDYTLYSDTFISENGIFSQNEIARHKNVITNFVEIAEWIINKYKL